MASVTDYHIGNEYGCLTVLSVVRKKGARYYHCVCTCGRAVDRPANKGITHRSHCGAMVHRLTHGHRLGRKHSPTMYSWHSMMARCLQPNHDRYKSYGAKGVRVAARWQKFTGFLEDMGPRPEGTTLGRILDRGDYETGNVFWMTRAEQSLHKMNNNHLRAWEELRASYTENRQ